VEGCEEAVLCAAHVKRVTVMVKDLALARSIRGGRGNVGAAGKATESGGGRRRPAGATEGGDAGEGRGRRRRGWGRRRRGGRAPQLLIVPTPILSGIVHLSNLQKKQ